MYDSVISYHSEINFTMTITSSKCDTAVAQLSLENAGDNATSALRQLTPCGEFLNERGRYGAVKNHIKENIETSGLSLFTLACPKHQVSPVKLFSAPRSMNQSQMMSFGQGF